jgi:acetyl esterase/lipase
VGWAWAYLSVSVVGAALVVNAYRPWRSGPVSVFSFFGGWLTGELPIQNIVWQALATVGFGFLGAFKSWPGWLGLGVSLGVWIGLIGLERSGRTTVAIVDRALAEQRITGDDSTRVEPDIDPRLSETMWTVGRRIFPIARSGRAFRMFRNIDYAGDGQKRHRLDVIVKRQDSPKAGPVMIYIHGGAWIIGDKREQGFPMMLELARRGWVCVTVNYGLSPKATWPDHIVDAKLAVAWVRENIGEYGGDPGFVCVSGGSAGGHLSALVALTAGDPAFQPGFEDRDTHVEACVPVYGVYDMTCAPVDGDPRYVNQYKHGLLRLLERRVFKTTYAENPGIFEQASPLLRVNGSAPPFFVIHGMNDTLVPVGEARRFVKALREVSSEAVLYAELPRTQHAFDVLASARPARVIGGIVRFLEGVRSTDLHHPVDPEPEFAARESAGTKARPDVPSHPG